MDDGWEMENLLSAGIRLLRGYPRATFMHIQAAQSVVGLKEKKKEYMELGEKKQRVRKRLKKRDGVDLIKIHYLHI